MSQVWYMLLFVFVAVCSASERHSTRDGCCRDGIFRSRREELNTDKPGAKAVRMCQEYSKYVFSYDNSTLNSGNKRLRIDLCHADNTQLIAEGGISSHREFPHLALVGYEEANNISWLCTGSLISPRFVLTAAHCYRISHNQRPHWVRVGDFNIKETTDNVKPQEAEVIEWIAHPDYNRNSVYNDIALLKLDRNLDLNEFVRPACLHTTFDIENSNGIVAGWGFRNSLGDVRMKATLPIQSSEKCQEIYDTTKKLSIGIVEDKMLCVGQLQARRDTCMVDSGAPLQLLMKSPYCMYDIIGVASFGKSICEATDSPVVFTRVSYYLPWIEKIVWP